MLSSEFYFIKWILKITYFSKLYLLCECSKLMVYTKVAHSITTPVPLIMHKNNHLGTAFKLDL